MKRVLVIAYHFPPLAGSSGVQRTLRFVQHLPRHGWTAVVLTCQPRAYDEVKTDLLADIPAGTIVQRAPALDTARHLAVAGRYPAWLARPDRWITWWPGAVWAGRGLIRRLRPSAIYSTYPIATAHVIGHSLERWSGLPWIADFRDPMAQEGYPPDPKTWKSFRRVEERVFAHAAACTFTTPGAARAYRATFPHSRARMEVIENGYDEDSFAEVERASPKAEAPRSGARILLHSGIVYPSERDPRQLFAALASLKQRGIGAHRLQVRFRAAVHESFLTSLGLQHGVEDMIEVAPHLQYRDALREMVQADGLLLLQAANCNEQIPAKLYEYLRAGRPVLAFTDPAGDTAGALRASGISAIARLDNSSEIAAVLARFADGELGGMVARADAIAHASRQARAEQLARLLDEVADRPQTHGDAACRRVEAA